METFGFCREGSTNDVTGLEIAVDHARRMRRIEALRHLAHNRQGDVGRHGTQPAQARGKRFAAKQLHRQAEHGTARPFETEQIVGGTDVSMVHFAREQNFALEACAHFDIAGNLGPQGF